jgi:hypothetical protein
MSRLLRLTTLWLWGGFLYYCIEIAWRGSSHPAMFIVGGCCFILLGGINNWFPWTLGLVWQALIGAAAVTLMELVSGLIINRWLGWGVWDYNDMPFNVAGQICLLYSLLWILLSLIGILLDDYFRWRLFDEKKPRYTLF